MAEIYYLYSIRSQGWVTPMSTYTSALDQAKTFTRDEALATVRKHVERGNHRMIPVRKDDL